MIRTHRVRLYTQPPIGGNFLTGLLLFGDYHFKGLIKFPLFLVPDSHISLYLTYSALSVLIS